MTTHKKYFIIILLLLFYSCEESQLLNSESSGTLTPEQAINSSESLCNYLGSAYNSLRDSSCFGGNLWLVSDLLAGDIKYTGQLQSWREIAHYSAGSDNSISNGIWKTMYQAIDKSNYVLQRLVDISMPADSMELLRGQALFIRGLGHFELVRLFSHPWDTTLNMSDVRGIPIRLTSSFSMESASKKTSISSVQETYNQVIKDFSEAITLLDGKIQGSMYANVNAARAMLSKVYFQQNNYDSAFFYADLIVQNRKYTLYDSVQNMYSPNNPDINDEFIFQLKSTSVMDNSSGALQQAYSISHDSLLPDFLPTDQIIALMSDSTDDNRWKHHFNLFINPVNNDSIFCITKFAYPYMSIPVITFSEMVFIRLESAVMINKTGVIREDLEDFYKIMERAYKHYSQQTGNDYLRNLVRLEKRKEFTFQGLRLHEIKRNHTGVDHYSWNDRHLILKIPKNE